jgi:hypothetical protein
MRARNGLGSTFRPRVRRGEDEHVPLPINIPKRGLSKEEAAEYCGVSVNTLIRHGPTATKIGDRTIYDRRVLDRWLDGLAGPPSSELNGAGEQPTPEEKLLERINARKTALRHTPE